MQVQVQVQEVNRLLKEFEQMQSMMKQMKGAAGPALHGTRIAENAGAERFIPITAPTVRWNLPSDSSGTSTRPDSVPSTPPTWARDVFEWIRDRRD